MDKFTLAVKIDVTKIDKNRLFQGKNGAQYLDAVIMYSADADQYGQNGMIVQSVSKEERESGVKGNILGNCKHLGQSKPQTVTSQGGNSQPSDDLPF
jgi:hypothetical protein